MSTIIMRSWFETQGCPMENPDLAYVLLDVDMHRGGRTRTVVRWLGREALIHLGLDPGELAREP